MTDRKISIKGEKKWNSFVMLTTCAPISFTVSHLVSCGRLITTFNTASETSQCRLLGTRNLGIFVLKEQADIWQSLCAESESFRYSTVSTHAFFQRSSPRLLNPSSKMISSDWQQVFLILKDSLYTMTYRRFIMFCHNRIMKFTS